MITKTRGKGGIIYSKLFQSYKHVPCSHVLTERTAGGPSPIIVKADTLIV